jgi:DNA-binding CsgD family transcriptional regulator
MFPHFPVTASASIIKMDLPRQTGHHGQVYSWEHLSVNFPLLHFLQPDFYMVFRFSNPGIPVFQQNLHLDFGTLAVKYETIREYTEKADLLHLHRMDMVINQFARDCRFQPFDFICTILVRWVSPVSGTRYFIRKTTVLECDDRGLPLYGIMAYKDVTPMVSGIKPNNVDVTFHPDKAGFCYEISKRIKAVQPKRIVITGREKDIVCCLSKGMSSKEIAAALFISKATVDTHRQNLIHKWEVTNTAALLQRAMDEGCI